MEHLFKQRWTQDSIAALRQRSELRCMEESLQVRGHSQYRREYAAAVEAGFANVDVDLVDRFSSSQKRQIIQEKVRTQPKLHKLDAHALNQLWKTTAMKEESFA